MRFKRFLPSLFLFVLIFSCEEDEVTLMTYPSFYYKAGAFSTGSMRVFTSKGEIKDLAIVNRLAAQDTASYNWVLKYESNRLGYMDSVSFFDSNHATLDQIYGTLDCSFSQEDNLLILTEIDIYNRCCTSMEVLSRTLPYYIGKVKPEIYSEYINSSTRGYYDFGFSGKRKFVFTKSGQQLVAPLLQFFRRSSQSSYFFESVNNVLQPDFYKNLAVGDTVTLVESLIRFEK